ncbi:hypothetical protein ABET51_11545 [Metabacillus fastidiosus]|uniref:hypothetical protein n=1 Tax=Metabacillus fastidiosus TaxID=1458 RepID=UPI002E1E7106|nr:hypothetical protein [Metabacillus fastidiosus]
MVFIPPIQSDAYTQYVNRSVAVKSDYALLTAVSPIHLNKKYFEEERKHSDRRSFSKILEAKKKQQEEGHPSTFHLETGSFFDECV